MSHEIIGDPIEILLVEDNYVDVKVAEEALKESKLLNNLNVVGDGEEAMKYLRNEPPYEKAAKPDLILLDWNLPKKDGKETLFDIKNDKKLKRIPVVVLTVSEDEGDILDAYEFHANCYISKPVDFEKFENIVKKIEDFWFSIVKLPKKQNIM